MARTGGQTDVPDRNIRGETPCMKSRVLQLEELEVRVRDWSLEVGGPHHPPALFRLGFTGPTSHNRAAKWTPASRGSSGWRRPQSPDHPGARRDTPRGRPQIAGASEASGPPVWASFSGSHEAKGGSELRYLSFQLASSPVRGQTQLTRFHYSIRWRLLLSLGACSKRTTSARQFLTASCMGVSPPMSALSLSAPASSKQRTTS